MQFELKRIQREVGITFLYVTHDQSEAMAMADRLGVMNAGRLEGLGVPEKVYDRPPTQFVAEFLGTCNVLPLSGDGTLPDGSAVAVDGSGTPSGPGWRLGIRPEKLELTPATHATGEPNRITATVADVTYLGATTEAHLETAWGTILQAFRQNSSVNALRPGDKVEVSWASSQCFYLPPGDGAPVTGDPQISKETVA
jgi:spermidine/putrescine transport system ATP-binding protein